MLLALTVPLIYTNMRRLHYRDAPYLFPGRCLLWAGLSLLAHSAILLCVTLLLLERYSLVWWVLVLIGSLPILAAFRYAVLVARNPRRMVSINKSKWKGPELVS
ncbi:hypothetical protein DKM44_13300 [Deinococcus irradiatisoli]|uniref:Uncharacterized protein n=1 Tax=Deinococcus irradiatisoli TaxID=2202254 RepID=A0A2Z3JRZ4_9DEIO|nr:hypothetical protein DKM44_13300 [Deinococcus irradiatisoli]